MYYCNYIKCYKYRSWNNLGENFTGYGILKIIYHNTKRVFLVSLLRLSILSSYVVSWISLAYKFLKSTPIYKLKS